MKNLTYAHIAEACAARGYRFFDSGPYDLNVFGVRAANRDFTRDAFDDLIGCAWLDEHSRPQCVAWPATTDPGLTHIAHPQFAEAIAHGTAFIAAGQHARAYATGWHGGGAWRHRALVQVAQVTCHRVKTRDANNIRLEDWPTSRGLYGVNIHHAAPSGVTARVGAYSAGCQVFQQSHHLAALVALVDKQVALGLGRYITYTLFNEREL